MLFGSRVSVCMCVWGFFCHHRHYYLAVGLLLAFSVSSVAIINHVILLYAMCSLVSISLHRPPNKKKLKKKTTSTTLHRYVVVGMWTLDSRQAFVEIPKLLNCFFFADGIENGVCARAKRFQ